MEWERLEGGLYEVATWIGRYRIEKRTLERFNFRTGRVTFPTRWILTMDGYHPSEHGTLMSAKATAEFHYSNDAHNAAWEQRHATRSTSLPVLSAQNAPSHGQDREGETLSPMSSSSDRESGAVPLRVPTR